MTETDDFVARRRPGSWPVLHPALARLGQSLQSPECVLQWLQAPATGSHAQAASALAAAQRQAWSLSEGASGEFTLDIGEHRWRLVPRPQRQPLHWLVERL